MALAAARVLLVLLVRAVLGLLAMVGCGVLGLLVIGRGVLGLLATVGLPVIDGRSQHRLGGAVSAARRNLALALLGNPDRAIVRKQGDAEFEFGQMGLTIQRI